MVNHHPKLISPWYADSDDGTLIHRYQNDEFIESFLKESTQGLLKGNRQQDWLEEDKFGTDKTRLRLPIHRTFYVVATESVCDVPFSPAFSPKKIVSAGFVVRKRSKDSMKIWRVKDGVELGWRDPDSFELIHDPDAANRHQLSSGFTLKNFTSTEYKSTGYSGEKTYPMHIHLVEKDKKNHTLLYGYLPLSGTATGIEVPVEAQKQQNDFKNKKHSPADNYQVSAAGYLAELEWPYGSWNGEKGDRSTCDCTGSMQQIIANLCNTFSWSNEEAHPVKSGIPSRAFSRWIGMLLTRYRVYDESISENQELRNILQSLHIVNKIKIKNKNKNGLSEIQIAELINNQEKDSKHKPETFWTYITSTYMDAEEKRYVYDDVLAWFSEQQIKHSSLDDVPQYWSPLPHFTDDIYITESTAESIRGACLVLAEKAFNVVEAELPLPRYTQGENDLYFVLPFIRYLDECGCQKIKWGQESFSFKVASPFDPEAVRPSVIQLPELKDIKKGFAKGVTFLTPKSLADAMLKIAPTMDMKQKDTQSPIDACGGFSISFNIPIITICALILLMIVLNILNLIFRWIPYAILMLPRLCFPPPPPR